MHINKAKSCVAISILVLFWTSCTRPPEPPAKSTAQLKRIAAPVRAFSIAGEVLAYEAHGQNGPAPISLKRWQGRFGDFTRALVFEYDKSGTVLSKQEMNVPPDGAIAINARAGNRYLIYPDLGSQFRNTYVVACNLTKVRISGKLVPRLCTEILCSEEPFKATELTERVPELKTQNVSGLGDGVIGGFGGSGNICDQCLHTSDPNGDFVPASGCSDRVPVEADPPRPADHIVFTRRLRSNDPAITQIFKLTADATETNLSNNSFFERTPDVNHNSRRIVFQTEDSGLTIMDLNGNNRTNIPTVFFGGNPRWSRNDESFVIFTNRPSNLNNSLRRVTPNGNENIVIATALSGQFIQRSDVIDDNHVIFFQSAVGSRADLFIKDMRNSDPPLNITNTPDVDERHPVVSHDGQLIAFLMHAGPDAAAEEIHIARLTLPGTLTDLHVFRMSPPAGTFIHSFDFSSDDKRLIVSVTILETQGTTNTHQLFSINIDGTGQIRLTVNDDSDLEPSVIPN